MDIGDMDKLMLIAVLGLGSCPHSISLKTRLFSSAAVFDLKRQSRAEVQ